jgi:arylsulfatase A-like enzyme
VLALSVAACNQDASEAQVGESLLDFVRQEHLEAYPPSNLPREVLDGIDDGPVTLRSQEFAARDWVQGPLPADVLEALGHESRVLLWRLQPQVARSTGRRPPIVVRAGTPVEHWDAGSGPFPGLSAWYEEGTGSVFALSESEPSGLSLEYLVEPSHELDLCEKLLDGADPRRPRAANAVPAVDALVQRVELNQTSRRSLLLPAGASLAMPFEAFPAHGLRLAVGIIDRSWRFDAQTAQRVLVPERSLSDGAVFSVEVLEGSAVHQVWTRHVDARYIRWGYTHADVDLSRWRGKPITLRLRTDAGPSGDPSFDYGVWSDLTLCSATPVPLARPHIVLIDIDTLRADRMSCYGYQRPTTPRIDAWLERGGIRYEDSLSPASWTLPSTASLLTGLAPHQHLAVDLERRLSDEVTTLAEQLRDSGYQTIGSAEGPFLGRAYGLDAGFDEHQAANATGDAAAVAARWRMQLERLKPDLTGRPIFLFLQTYLVHAPYRFDTRFEGSRDYAGKLCGQDVDYPAVINPYERGDLELSAEDKEYVSAQYDAGVARMDEVVGDFLEELEAALGTQVLVILTSDHGEELFEHAGMTHGHSLYDELLRVPMLVRFPPGLGPREAVSRVPVSLLDIAPTVLEVAGVQAPGLPGQSLLSSFPEDRLRVSQTGGLSAVSLNAEKLILGQHATTRRMLGPVEYYRIDEDPGELRNLAESNSDRAQRLERALADYLAAHPGAVQEPEHGVIDQAAMSELRLLGYIGN